MIFGAMIRVSMSNVFMYIFNNRQGHSHHPIHQNCIPCLGNQPGISKCLKRNDKNKWKVLSGLYKKMKLHSMKFNAKEVKRTATGMKEMKSQHNQHC